MSSAAHLYCMRYAALIILLLTYPAYAESSASRWQIGGGVQLYPAGAIVDARVSRSVGERDAVWMRLGYNKARRQDFGEHTDEQGGGSGASLGYRRFFGASTSDGLYFAFAVDWWDLRIDWWDKRTDRFDRNARDPVVLLLATEGRTADLSAYLLFTRRTGRTGTDVLQPTVQTGYAWMAGTNCVLSMSMSLGAEVNTHTRGESVGQGPILLFGMEFGFRL